MKRQTIDIPASLEHSGNMMTNCFVWLLGFLIRGLKQCRNDLEFSHAPLGAVSCEL